MGKQKKMSSKLKKFNVLWFCPIADPSGYGFVSRQYLKQLNKYDDLNIRIIPRSFNCGGKLKLSADDRKMFEGMIETDFRSGLPILTVFHLQPNNFDLVEGSNKHIGLTVFETDSVPQNWKPKMRLMDEIWTFSGFCKTIFEKETGKRVATIPHGVDSEKYKSGLAPVADLKKMIRGRFAFGSNFTWQPRKNPVCLIEAYFREFMNGQGNVCLVLKVLGADGAYVKNEIYKIKDRIGLNNDFPEVLLITDTVPDDQMPSFYNSLDAYVLLSKGEGFSISHMEAMACGLPTIGTNWGGNLDFMNKDNSYLVPCSIERVSNADAVQQPIFKNQRWANISVREAQKALRMVYGDENRVSIGRRAESDMKTWTWEVGGDLLYENIVRLMNG